MQKIVANNFAFSQGGDVTASLRRLWRFYGVPTECYCVPSEFQLAIGYTLTARPRRARSGHRARTARAASKARSRLPLILSLKQLNVILRKRHSSSDIGGVTHTFAIRFITSSFDIRMAGKNKKLKAGKTEGKGRESVVLRLLIHSVHRHCASLGQAVEEPPMSLNEMHNVCIILDLHIGQE